MNVLMDFLPWILIVLGAIVTFGAKPFFAKKAEAQDESTADSQQKTMITIKIIGMWLVIIGAVMIFISGGIYGR